MSKYIILAAILLSACETRGNTYLGDRLAEYRKEMRNLNDYQKQLPLVGGSDKARVMSYIQRSAEKCSEAVSKYNAEAYRYDHVFLARRGYPPRLNPNDCIV